MNVMFKGSFARDLKGIKDQSIKREIKILIESIERAQSLQELPNVKKLKGNDHHYRVKLGDYRIGLLVDGDTVSFVRFLHRKDIYRYFP